MRKRQRISDQLKQTDHGGGNFKDFTIKDDVVSEVIFANKDSAIAFGILPAIAVDEDGEYDKSAYLPYRDEDDYFTEWLWVFQQWRFVGGTCNILSPKFFGGPEETDPLELLWDVAWRNESYWEIIGRDPITKKISNSGDEWKTRLLRRSETRVGMNVVVAARRKLENRFLICSRQSIFPFDYVELPLKSSSKKRKDSGSWGLAESLDTLVKGHEKFEQDDFENRFYDGDITDPRNMAMCEVALCRPPQGGMPVYNAYVMEEEPRFKITSAHLRARLTPEEVFVNMDPIETATEAAKALLPHGGEVRSLLEDAWGNEGVEYEALLSRLLGSSSSAAKPKKERSTLDRGAGSAKRGKLKEESEEGSEEEEEDLPKPKRASRGSLHEEEEDEDIPAPKKRSRIVDEGDDDEGDDDDADADADSDADMDEDDGDLPPPKKPAGKKKVDKEEEELPPIDEDSEEDPPFEEEDDLPKKTKKNTRTSGSSKSGKPSGGRAKIAALLGEGDDE